LRVHDRDMKRIRQSQLAPRYPMCHRALRGTPVHVPAASLTTAAVAQWVRRRGLGVDVTSAGELRAALSAGLPAARIAAQCGDVATVEAAVAAKVGRFVVGSWSEVMLLVGRRASTPRVLVDVSDAAGERLAASAVPMSRLEVVGLRCRVGTSGRPACEAVSGMVEQMVRLRRAHGVILTRICLTGFGSGADAADLRQGVHRLQLAVEDGCALWRYPRPALMLSLDASALVETN
jgi:diaminopimelate decarboxylase